MNTVSANKVLLNKVLPIQALTLISEYSKPLTRPDWKTKPVIDFLTFYQNLRRRQKYNVICDLIYKIHNHNNTLTIYYTFLNNITIVRREDYELKRNENQLRAEKYKISKEEYDIRSNNHAIRRDEKSLLITSQLLNIDISILRVIIKVII